MARDGVKSCAKAWFTAGARARVRVVVMSMGNVRGHGFCQGWCQCFGARAGGMSGVRAADISGG